MPPVRIVTNTYHNAYYLQNMSMNKKKIFKQVKAQKKHKPRYQDWVPTHRRAVEWDKQGNNFDTPVLKPLG